MKFTEKTVIIALLMMVGLFTACNHGNDQSSQNNLSVSTNEVILQSIEKLENMVTPTTAVNSGAAFSYIAPNVTFEYEKEKESLFEGVELAKEFSKYLGTQQDMVDNIIYHDSVLSQENVFYADVYGKKYVVDDLVCVSLQVTPKKENYEEGDLYSEYFHAYFEYNYEIKSPLGVTIVDIKEYDSGEEYALIVAQFDFTSDSIYGY